MRVKCVLCERIDKIDDLQPLAKRLRNRPIHTYMCDTCHARITERTKARKASGTFIISHQKEEENEWF